MRGSILDNIIIMTIVFLFAFGTLVGYVLYKEFYNTISQYYPAMAQNKAVQNLPHIFSIFDFGILTMIILFGITSIALAARIRTHPVFFVISFILFLISVYLAWIYSNIFEMLMHYSLFDVAAAYLSTLCEVMLQYSMIFAVIGLLILLATYTKLYEIYTYGR